MSARLPPEARVPLTVEQQPQAEQVAPAEPAAPGLDLLIDEVRLWDGTGAPAQNAVDVRIRGGVIAEIADEIAPPADARLQVLDGSGFTAIPGLIDAHVHLSLDPGGGLRADTPEVRDALLRQHLAGYLACGVTTVVDPAVTFAEWDRIDAALAGGAPGPRYLALGPPFSPPGGYVSVVLPEFPSVADADAVDAQFVALAARGAVGAKVTVEPGFVRPIWPMHTPQVLTAIRAGAEARGLPIYAHARTVEAQAVAIDTLGAKVLVHGLDRPSRAGVARAADAGVYVLPTLSTLDANRAAWTPSRLTDPLVRRAVPTLELDTASDPDAVHRFARAMVETVLPGVPAKGLVASLLLRESTVRGRLRRASAAVRAMRDAGVPLVLGSDSGNWPILPFEFHGPTSIRELELMVEAGLSPEQALVAATRTPAEMLGEVGVFGTLAVGAAADLVLVRGDPLADIRALRDVGWVVAAGVAKTPDQWASAGRESPLTSSTPASPAEAEPVTPPAP